MPTPIKAPCPNEIEPVYVQRERGRARPSPSWWVSKDNSRFCVRICACRQMLYLITVHAVNCECIRQRNVESIYDDVGGEELPASPG